MDIQLTSTNHGISEVKYNFTETPFGEMLTAHAADAVCFAAFTTYRGRKVSLDELKKLFPFATFSLSAEISDVIACHPQRILLVGTPFRHDVWRALLQIPQGKTTTYSHLATLAGHPRAIRAVASAIGANPIQYTIPCHRIIPTSGGIGNYHSGTAIKKQLLDWEGALR